MYECMCRRKEGGMRGHYLADVSYTLNQETGQEVGKPSDRHGQVGSRSNAADGVIEGEEVPGMGGGGKEIYGEEKEGYGWSG